MTFADASTGEPFLPKQVPSVKDHQTGIRVEYWIIDLKSVPASNTCAALVTIYKRNHAFRKLRN